MRFFFPVFFTKIDQLWKPFLYKSRLFFQQFYVTFALVVGICTGYPLEIIINAFTISSLILILVKLGFSILSIKLSIIIQLLLLLIFIPVYIKYNVFDLFRTFLATFFRNYLPESCHEELDPDRDDPGYECPEDDNDSWYNHGLLFIIHFFILLRLFLLSEPFLSLSLKFIIIRYFIINEYLVVAYTISLVFIFSRFIFFLSDQTLGYWKMTIKDTLEREEEIPKITKKNILIMTHWSLRDIKLWKMFLNRRNEDVNGKLEWDLRILLHELKDKFELFDDKIKTIPKNRYCIKSIIIISFFVFLYYIL